jgi:hypothetical protein
MLRYYLKCIGQSLLHHIVATLSLAAYCDVRRRVCRESVGHIHAPRCIFFVNVLAGLLSKELCAFMVSI